MPEFVNQDIYCGKDAEFSVRIQGVPQATNLCQACAHRADINKAVNKGYILRKGISKTDGIPCERITGVKKIKV